MLDRCDTPEIKKVFKTIPDVVNIPPQFGHRGVPPLAVSPDFWDVWERTGEVVLGRLEK